MGVKGWSPGSSKMASVASLSKIFELDHCQIFHANRLNSCNNSLNLFLGSLFRLTWFVYLVMNLVPNQSDIVGRLPWRIIP